MTKEQVLGLQTYKLHEGDTELYVSRDDVLELLEKYPERKKGKWIVHGEYKQTIDGRTFDGWCECSNCHMNYRYEFQSLNFCPNCGTDMRRRR